jgi:hypothetical protein
MDKLLAFNIFGIEYFLYLFLAIILVGAFVFVGRNLSSKGKKVTQISLLLILGILMVLEYIGRIVAIEEFKLFNNLPIQSFNMFFYILLFAYISKNNNWKKFIYLIVLPISVYSMIFPQNFYMNMSAFSLPVITYELLNISMILFSVLNIMWLDDQIVYKDILRSTMDFCIIIAVVHIINVVFRFTAWGLEANYFGTMGEDYNTLIGIIDNVIKVPLLLEFPLIAILVGIEYLMVLPFVRNRKRKERQGRIEELVALGNFKAQQENFNTKGKSQILIRSSEKAMPTSQNKTSTSIKNGGFVSTIKEVKTNNDIIDKNNHN